MFHDQFKSLSEEEKNKRDWMVKVDIRMFEETKQKIIEYGKNKHRICLKKTKKKKKEYMQEYRKINPTMC